MNKKGFTLVEFIVAITILGIITALAFSGVTGIVENNRKKKFEEYGNSLIYSAKIYVDSYSEDMFYSGGAETKCHKLNLQTLINSGKVKDFSQKDITCTNIDDPTKEDSAIYIYKVDRNNYFYNVELKCRDSDKDTEMYNDSLNQFDRSTSCGANIAED